MNRRKKVVIGVAAAVVVVGGGGGGIAAYLYYRVMQPGIHMRREIAEARIRLLCEIDHQALLDACRQLSRHVISEKPEGDTYVGQDISQLPEPIPSLRPHHVAVYRDGRVRIEMYTGWSPLGVYASPTGHEKLSVKYGQRRLLEGLWYYDDGYRFDPEYDRRIDALLTKCGKAR